VRSTLLHRIKMMAELRADKKSKTTAAGKHCEHFNPALTGG
jgi:hypothetical protein